MKPKQVNSQIYRLHIKDIHFFQQIPTTLCFLWLKQIQTNPHIIFVLLDKDTQYETLGCLFFSPIAETPAWEGQAELWPRSAKRPPVGGWGGKGWGLLVFLFGCFSGFP